MVDRLTSAGRFAAGYVARRLECRLELGSSPGGSPDVNTAFV